MRKLNGNLMPLTEALAQAAAPAPEPEPVEAPPTAAELLRRLAGQIDEVAAALEREDEYLDSELARVHQRITALEASPSDPTFWPLLMDSATASDYTGLSMWQVNELARQGALPRVMLGGGVGYRYRRADLDALANQR